MVSVFSRMPVAYFEILHSIEAIILFKTTQTLEKNAYWNLGPALAFSMGLNLTQGAGHVVV